MAKTPSTPSATPAAPDEPRGERLQKILAAAGIASRRKAEELILEGRVQVNGTVIKELGTRHDAERDHIRVDGKLLHGPGTAPLLHAQQAARIRDHARRSAAQADSDGSDAGREGAEDSHRARVPGGPAGLPVAKVCC